MSIASAITAAQGKVANCYTAISNKGGTLPATQDLSNMPTAINSISTPTLITKTINYNGTYNASLDNADGYPSVTVNVSGGGSSTKYGCTIDSLLGDVDANGVLKIPTSLNGNITFNGVKDIGNYALYNKFYRCAYGNFEVSFPDLETISGTQALYNMFYSVYVTSISMPKLKTISGVYGVGSFCTSCSRLTEVNLPELTTISGNSGAYSMFYFCSNVTTVSLPKLQEVSGDYGMNAMLQGTKISTITFPALSNLSGSAACGYIFGNCTSISSISFPALTTTSFGSYVNQFSGMFDNSSGSISGAFTMHFPSNLSSTIAGLTGYPNFGATAGRLTLAFDLPATT